MRRHSTGTSSATGVMTGFFVMLVLGLAALAIGGYQLFQRQQFMNRAESVTGTVISNESEITSGGKSQICPKIRFTTRAGQAISYIGGDCDSTPVYAVGTAVQVYYDPQNPTEPHTGGLQYGAALFALGMGVLFLLIAIVMFFNARLKRAREQETNARLQGIYQRSGLSEEETKKLLDQNRK